MGEQRDTKGIGRLIENIIGLPMALKRAIFRHGLPDSSRTASQGVFSNVFLHIHAVRTHRWSLKKGFTLGLGTAAMASFLILCATGLVLMVYFKPSTAFSYPGCIANALSKLACASSKRSRYM